MNSFLLSFTPSTDSGKAVVSCWRKYGHLLLVNCLMLYDGNSKRQSEFPFMEGK